MVERNSQLSRAGVAGRVFATLFFLVFLGAGLLFGGMFVRDLLETAAMRGWLKTECVILESGVREDARGRNERPYSFAVQYRYSWQGRSYTSDQYARRPVSGSNYQEMQKLAERFEADTKAFCYVNPANPAEAVLKRATAWHGFFIVIPLIFVAVGGGSIYYTWRPRKPADPAKAARAPISSVARAGRSAGCMALFFGLFLAAGCAMLFFMAIRPVFKIVTAANWPATPCVVVSSRVQSHSSDDGTTYSVDILYAYEFNGREYKSNRYHFLGGSSSGYGSKAAIVRGYPPGMRTTCYVNPRDPTEAVLERGLTKDLWVGLFALPFMAAGLAGMIWARRLARKSPAVPTPPAAPAASSPLTSGRIASLAALEPLDTGGSGPVVLKARQTRVGLFVISLIVAGIWNVILFFGILRETFHHWDSSLSWFTLLFLMPFFGIGLGLLGWAGYSFLRLFNPSVTLTMSARAVPLGGELDVQWDLSGSVASVLELRIFLEGREEATYQRGTDTSTDNHVFARLPVAAVTDLHAILSGQARVAIPADTMHSFQSGDNKIVWSLQVQGEIRRWPDVKEEFPITVLPLANPEVVSP